MIYNTKTVCLILALLISIRSTAQKAVSFNAGLAVSWQSTRLSGQHHTTDPLIGPAFQAAFEIPYGERWVIQPAAGFIQKGGVYPDNFTGAGSGGQSLRISELDFAVRAKYLWPADKCSFYVALGPYVGFLLSEKLHANGQTTTDPGPYNAAEFGLSGGPGLQFQGKSALFFVEARYLLGLSPVNDNGDSPVAAKSRLHSAVLSAGIKFHVGGKKDD